MGACKNLKTRFILSSGVNIKN